MKNITLDQEEKEPKEKVQCNQCSFETRRVRVMEMHIKEINVISHTLDITEAAIEKETQCHWSIVMIQRLFTDISREFLHYSYLFSVFETVK